MPSPTIGATSRLKAILEQTYAGSVAAGGAQDFGFVSSGIKPAATVFPGDPSLGSMAPKLPMLKLKHGEGDSALPVRYESFTNLWHVFFGKIYDEAQIAATTVYKRFFYPHSSFNEYVKGPTPTITPGYRSFRLDQVLPSGGSDYGYRYTGAMIQAIRFNITNESLLITPSWLLKTPAQLASDPGAAVFSTKPMVYGGSIGAGQGLDVQIVNRGGAAGTAFNASDAEIVVEIPHMNDREFLGDFNMQEPVLNGPMTIQITVNRENKDSNLLADWSGPQAKEIRFKWSGPIAASSTRYEFELYFPYCLISGVGPDISDNGVVGESLTFDAYWDEDTGTRGTMDVATTKLATNMWLREQNLVVSAPIIT